MVEVRRLTPDELEGFLSFMGGPAFATNPQWAGCYCQFYLDSPDSQTPSEDKEQINRQKACDRISDGTMHGYLAFDGEKVIGWLAANKGNNFKMLPPTSETTARMLCFVVDKNHQRQGVASALLNFAVEDLGRQGFEIVEAAPLASDQFESWGYRGKLSTFIKAGFEAGSMIDDKHILVQRKLSD